jgi:hypothetical protein
VTISIGSLTALCGGVRRRMRLGEIAELLI